MDRSQRGIPGSPAAASVGGIHSRKRPLHSADQRDGSNRLRNDEDVDDWDQGRRKRHRDERHVEGAREIAIGGLRVCRQGGDEHDRAVRASDLVGLRSCRGIQARTPFLDCAGTSAENTRREGERSDPSRLVGRRVADQDDLESECAPSWFPRELQSFEPYFVISAGIPQQLDHEHLRHICKELGLRETSVPTKHYDRNNLLEYSSRPVFVWAELRNNRYSVDLYGLQCGIKNLLSNEKYVISRKDSLAAQLTERGGRSYLPETVICSRDVDAWLHGIDIQADDVFIFRPVDSYGGQGVSVIQNPSHADILRAIDTAEESVRKLRNRGTVVLMSRYCKNPLLFHGRKCHFRGYFLAVLTSDRRLRTFLWDQGKVLTASKPYVYASFEDTGIHDTHFKTTDRDYLFPVDLPSGGVSLDIYSAKIRPGMECVMKLVSAILVPHAKLFRECRHGFEVFGVDFLVQEDGSVLLLEVNDKLAYSCHDPAFCKEFSADLFRWIGECVLAPVLGRTPFPDSLFEAQVLDESETGCAQSLAAMDE